MADSVVRASVVVLYRDVGQRGLEVFWCQRALGLPFLGGFWAFPGGHVNPVDAGTPVTGATAEMAPLIAAAARELREETGVVVPLDAARFVPAGETISPRAFRVRYHANYFLVEAPPGAEPDVACSEGELIAGEWIRPADALAMWERGERFTTSVLVSAMRGLATGLSGAAARIALPLGAEDDQRIWDILPGLSVAPLVTPTLPPATHTNCYVVGGEELIVIDPASPHSAEQEALEAILEQHAARGRRVREIWLTHHHLDHVSGAARLAAKLGVPVAAHAITAGLVAGRIEVSRHLDEGHVEVMAAGGGFPERRLRCLFTPGHAPGHLCFLEETSGLVFCGDMVAGLGTIIVDPDEGDMGQYIASLRRLRELAPRMLCPSHGPMMIDVAGKLDEYVQHRLWREEKVAAALGARGEAAPIELVKEVYDDVPAALYPLAARSLEAHLKKLVKDGRATADAAGRYAAAATAPATRS